MVGARMFDINEFKRQVKIWIADHPGGEVNDLVDYCEEIIPMQYFAANKWLIDQTVSWYRHILAQREAVEAMGDGDPD